ncbi:hypothetical protein [Peribacillus simplex]|uniref:Uncharacterized protein n=1 Tax=Peribacillus simplex TaxID=1478 RepID=A0A9W4PDR2_9BACI|nr:hypothetical protein [Peribacillus simplex]WHX92163.1 hypothetical protein QNH50_04645 [Peribacillus simplex]CAH0199105.1 hypothetical protein SRABI133_01876 [Peribacillus simplex]
MRRNVSLARLIESNKENLNNNQLFIDLIEEKVHKKQVEMQERPLTKQAGDNKPGRSPYQLTTQLCDYGDAKVNARVRMDSKG